MNPILTQHSSCQVPPTFLTAKLPERTGSSLSTWSLYTQAENNNLELTCSKAGQPACSKSDQTWEEAYQACRFHLFPGCSRSPPCRTHDSAPGSLSLQRSSCPMSPPAPLPPPTGELQWQGGRTSVLRAFALVLHCHRSPADRNLT